MSFSPLRRRRGHDPVASHTSSAPEGEAFAAALRVLEPGLRRFVARQLTRAEAVEDAVQETFLRALRYRQCSDFGEVRALLFRIADSVVADQYRHAHARQADRHCSLENVEIVSPLAGPDRVLSDRQSLDCVKEAIRQLPPRCRQVFLLHRFENMSYHDIARRLGISERTVENQIAHALAVCRRALGEYRGRTFK